MKNEPNDHDGKTCSGAVKKPYFCKKDESKREKDNQTSGQHKQNVHNDIDENNSNFCVLHLLHKKATDLNWSPFVGDEFNNYVEKATDTLLMSEDALRQKYADFDSLKRNSFVLQGPRGTGKTAVLKKVKEKVKEKVGGEASILCLFLEDVSGNSGEIDNTLNELKPSVENIQKQSADLWSESWKSWWNDWFLKKLSLLSWEKIAKTVVIIIDMDLFLEKAKGLFVSIEGYCSCFCSFFMVLNNIHQSLLQVTRGGVLVGLRKDWFEFFKKTIRTCRANYSHHWDKHYEDYFKKLIKDTVLEEQENFSNYQCVEYCLNCKYASTVEKWKKEDKSEKEYKRIFFSHVENGDHRPSRLIAPFKFGTIQEILQEKGKCHLEEIDQKIKERRDDILNEHLDLFFIVCMKTPSEGWSDVDKEELVQCVKKFIKQEIGEQYLKSTWSTNLAQYIKGFVNTCASEKFRNLFNWSAQHGDLKNFSETVIDYFINIRILAPASTDDYNKAESKNQSTCYSISKYFTFLYSKDSEMFNKYENQRGEFYDYTIKEN